MSNKKRFPRGLMMLGCLLLATSWSIIGVYVGDCLVQREVNILFMFAYYLGIIFGTSSIVAFGTRNYFLE